MNKGPVQVIMANSKIKSYVPMVACTNAEGLLNVHKETEICEVCANYCNCLALCAQVDTNGNCRVCGKSMPPG
jgi:hypothetical protein